MEQDAMTGASMSTVDCFDNGVKCSRSMDTSTSMTMTVKKDSDACYSMVMGLTTSGDTTMELRNAAGATVATIVESGTTGGQTIACPGGLPGPIDASCSVQAASASGLAKLMAGVSCPQGTCNF